MMAISMMGTFTRKTSRHPRPQGFACTRKPPSPCPAMEPTPEATPNHPIAHPRRSGATTVLMNASAWGSMTAALRPCMTRQAMRTPAFGAGPHSADVTAKAVSPAMNTRRRPSRSPRRPPVTRPAAYMKA